VPVGSVLITGGSRGIGAALVERFKRGGWRVAACARTKESLESAPPESRADVRVACDVSDPAAVASFVAEAVRAFGTLTAVINNAGIAESNPLEPGSSDELWHRIISTNLNGAYYVCKQSLAHLADGGRIVNIASVLALRGVPDQTAYCAAKHGVLGLTRALAQTLAPRRITVNAICPGWVRTDMARERLGELGWSEDKALRGVPLRRMIESGEVAELAWYLASSEGAANITGQALSIDGGVTA
jgi:NAD(P)-dependent dehydrogenase (short-subunit alcohol dehydrogenase family)